MDFLNKVAAGINRWIRLNALLLACMVVMRPVFFLEVYFRVGLEPIHFFTILSGALFDLLLVCRIFTYGLIPFLVLDRFFPKTARGIFVGLILLYTVLNALLAEYYCNLTMPLDHVLLVYTREELIAHGLNYSMQHADFMVGTADLSIVGTTYDGRKIDVFKDGNFAI